MNRRKMISTAAVAAAMAALPAGRAVADETGETQTRIPGSAELARSLPGDFRSGYAKVNGIRLHYVAGGHGEPLVLVPGWPQTWWSYHKIMPALAHRHRVIAVDIRGMGDSDKPQGGYDKKTMASDIHRLVRGLGHDSVNIAGHDIGAMVAYSFAANHPEATRKLAVLDVLHPDEGLYHLPMLVRPGKPDFNMWWFAFNQVEGLPEQLEGGRARALQDWLYDNSLVDGVSNIPASDRAIYAHAYDGVDAIRASTAWYKAIHTDIADMKTYPKLAMPVLGLACWRQWELFNHVLPTTAADVRFVEVEKSQHWLAEDAPELVSRSLLDFFA